MMETRTLVEKVRMLEIFWETQIDLIMKLKPTTVLDEKDVVSIKELASSTGQNVGIQAMDAQDIWKSFTTQYVGLMKLREKEVDTVLEDMLFDIHGMTAPLEAEVDAERAALQSDESASGTESPS